jgi:hypothetical protein
MRSNQKKRTEKEVVEEERPLSSKSGKMLETKSRADPRSDCEVLLPSQQTIIGEIRDGLFQQWTSRGPR